MWILNFIFWHISWDCHKLILTFSHQPWWPILLSWLLNVSVSEIDSQEVTIYISRPITLLDVSTSLTNHEAQLYLMMDLVLSFKVHNLTWMNNRWERFVENQGLCRYFRLHFFSMLSIVFTNANYLIVSPWTQSLC